MKISNEFKSMRDLVLNVLEKYPYTRENDTHLYLKCCFELGADTVREIEDLNLNFGSVEHVRRLIQYKEGLFLPDNKVVENRKKRQTEVKDYIKKVV